MSSGQIAIRRPRATPRPSSLNKQYNQVKIMKLTIKQRIRNWLMNDELEQDCYPSIPDEQNRLGSEGMRLQIYKASGGFVVETHNYDQRKDQSKYTMYVITEEQDLGENLGKIVMIEALRG
jgi:hypothetical protein